MGLFKKKDGTASTFGKIFSTVASVAGSVLPVPGLHQVTDKIAESIMTPRNQPGPQMGQTLSVPVNSMPQYSLPAVDGTGIIPMNLPSNNTGGMNLTTLALLGLGALILLKKK